MENKNIEELVFFKPGDLVVLNKKELGSPVMLIKDKVSRQFKTDKGDINNVFQGMKCIWFDKNMVLREAVFSTKDLKFYKSK